MTPINCTLWKDQKRSARAVTTWARNCQHILLVMVCARSPCRITFLVLEVVHRTEVFGTESCSPNLLAAGKLLLKWIPILRRERSNGWSHSVQRKDVVETPLPSFMLLSLVRILSNCSEAVVVTETRWRKRLLQRRHIQKQVSANWIVFIVCPLSTAVTNSVCSLTPFTWSCQTKPPWNVCVLARSYGFWICSCGALRWLPVVLCCSYEPRTKLVSPVRCVVGGKNRIL